MNIWKIVGNLFLGFGLIFLALDAIAGYTTAYVNSYFAAISPQTTLHLLITALTPYATIASFMFTIAAVGLYAARTSSFVQTTELSYKKPSSHPKSAEASVFSVSPYPPPQISTCPSCKQSIIFIDHYQKWYCIKEKRYV